MAKKVERCGVCDVNPAGPNGEICYDCSMTALAAYGWASGAAIGGQLYRGPADTQARVKLDKLTDDMKKRKAEGPGAGRRS